MSRRVPFQVISQSKEIILPKYALADINNDREDDRNAVYRAIMRKNGAQRFIVKPEGHAADWRYEDFSVTLAKTSGSIVGQCLVRFEN